MLKRVCDAACAACIELDRELTSVTCDGSGCTVVASVATFPDSEESRALLHSALHSVLLDEFEGEVAQLVVRVFVPSVVDVPPDVPFEARMTDPDTSVVAKVKNMVEDTHRFARLVTKNYAQCAVQEVVEGLPWRDPELMRRVAQSAVLHTLQMGTLDDPLMRGDVDGILLPLSSILNPFDQQTVFKDVEVFLGRRPTSLLETYESVFRLVALGRSCGSATFTLHRQLFDV